MNTVIQLLDDVLHLVSWQGNSALLKLLVEQGATIYAVDILKETPLHKAVRHSRDIIEILLNKDASVNAVNTSKQHHCIKYK